MKIFSFHTLQTPFLSQPREFQREFNLFCIFVYATCTQGYHSRGDNVLGRARISGRRGSRTAAARQGAAVTARQKLGVGLWSDRGPRGGPSRENKNLRKGAGSAGAQERLSDRRLRRPLCHGTRRGVRAFADSLPQATAKRCAG